MTDQMEFTHQGNCIRCGLCLAVCPTYREYLTETSSPRGRVALVNQALCENVEYRPNLKEQMYRCFGCLACDEICPAGVHPSEMILDMRNVQEKSHPSFGKELLFKGLIQNSTRLELVSYPLRLYERSGLRRMVGLTWGMKGLPGRFSDWEAMLPQLQHRPLRRILPPVTPADGVSRFRVGFFLGCAQSLIFGKASAATVRVLARNGCTVLTPRGIRCCGMPSISYGKRDLAIEQARSNIKAFERANVEAIITDCATCGSMLKSYAQLLSDDPEWSEKAIVFSKKVNDISEFLMKIPLVKPHRRINSRVTYHDPCHLRRGQGVWKEPRELLRMIDGVDLVEMAEAEWCCGSGGSHLITHYSLSRKVMQRKIDNLESTEAQVVASGCPACQMQLNVGIKQRGIQVMVAHPVQLLDWSYHGMRY